MTRHTHHFPRADEADGFYRCESCDQPRRDVLAYCIACREVTPSYKWEADAGLDYVEQRFAQEMDKWAATFANISGADWHGERFGG